MALVMGMGAASDEDVVTFPFLFAMAIDSAPVIIIFFFKSQISSNQICEH